MGKQHADQCPLQGDAELIYGEFRSRLPAEVRETVYAATKWCIFGPLNRAVTAEFVLEGIKERSRRLGGRVELLQFHWYDVSLTQPREDVHELQLTRPCHSTPQKSTWMF